MQKKTTTNATSPAPAASGSSPEGHDHTQMPCAKCEEIVNRRFNRALKTKAAAPSGEAAPAPTDERLWELANEIVHKWKPPIYASEIFAMLSIVRKETRVAAPTPAPPREAIEKNKIAEPQGERLRAELESWLRKNQIVTIILDTEHHKVSVDIDRLPPNIKSVLTLWGSIYVNAAAPPPGSSSPSAEPLPLEKKINAIMDEINAHRTISAITLLDELKRDLNATQPAPQSAAAPECNCCCTAHCFHPNTANSEPRKGEPR
jgi:hypothetical protein